MVVYKADALSKYACRLFRCRNLLQQRGLVRWSAAHNTDNRACALTVVTLY